MELPDHSEELNPDKQILVRSSSKMNKLNTLYSNCTRLLERNYLYEKYFLSDLSDYNGEKNVLVSFYKILKIILN